MVNPYYQMGSREIDMRDMFADYERFIADLYKAIGDEAEAAEFYTMLMKCAPNDFARDQIKHARDDERKHYGQLSRLYWCLTGRRPMIPKPRVEKVSYKKGLRIALDDELEAAEHYRSMLLATGNFGIRDLLFEIMTDEMEHATRFAFINRFK